VSSRPRIRSDDDWRTYRRRWLGPHPYTWPFEARYSAWALIGGILLAHAVAGLLLAALIGPLVAVALIPWSLAVTLPLGYLLLRLSGDETTIRQLVLLIWHERNLPREPAPIDRPQLLRIRRETS
jgi:hypothetical protein